MKENDQKNVIIGYRVKQLRQNRGFTQSKVAEKLEMSSQHYGTLERGVNAFSLDNVIKLCNFYNVPISSILGDLSTSDKKRTKDYEKLVNQIGELNAEHRELILHLIKYYKQLEKTESRKNVTKVKEKQEEIVEQGLKNTILRDISLIHNAKKE